MMLGFFLNRTVRRVTYTHTHPIMPFCFGAAAMTVDMFLKNKLVYHYFWGGGKYYKSKDAVLDWHGQKPYDKGRDFDILWLICILPVICFHLQIIRSFNITLITF